jgi:hypothetical protein
VHSKCMKYYDALFTAYACKLAVICKNLPNLTNLCSLFAGVRSRRNLIQRKKKKKKKKKTTL